MDIVIIPAYEPDGELITLTNRLSDEGFKVLVVDDGSGEKYSEIFSAAEKYATILKHEKNKGKGAALKTAMRHIRDCIPECEHFITCDADGQHKVQDVIRVRERLLKGDKFVLTVRERKTKIPFRSMFGNNLSRIVYALLTNKYLSDNQSGLRGFAREHIEWLCEVERDNYDYEMNVLYYASKKGVRISTIPIDAIYIGNNESSHFNPVKDTVRIYKSLFKLASASFISFAVIEVLILISTIFWGYRHLMFSLPSAAAIGYLITIILNRFVFFRHTKCYDYLTILIYTVIEYLFYYLLCTIFMLSAPVIPLWIAFNIVYIFCIPLRYYLHKFIFIASKPHD